MIEFNAARLHGQTFYVSLVAATNDSLNRALTETNALNFIANDSLVTVHSITDSSSDTRLVVLQVEGKAVGLALNDELPSKGRVADAIRELAGTIKTVHDTMRG